MADNGILRRPAERRVRREDRPEQLRWIAKARCLAATLDLLAQPIVLLVPDATPRVWHANAAARVQFTGDGLVRIRDGRLLFAEAQHGARMSAAVRRARSLGSAHPQTVELAGPDGRTAATLQVQALDFGASPDLPVSEMLLLEVHAKAPLKRGLQRLCDGVPANPQGSRVRDRAVRNGLARRVCALRRKVQSTPCAARSRRRCRKPTGIRKLVL